MRTGQATRLSGLAILAGFALPGRGGLYRHQSQRLVYGLGGVCRMRGPVRGIHWRGWRAIHRLCTSGQRRPSSPACVVTYVLGFSRLLLNNVGVK